ncbi:hypothetical protein PVAND_009909 [Polypedilum vanderplanki]|uniref:DNA-directed RNA polymerase III subunit RPC4 n=1 Tax=Polypedilum vanderplanki TaxID=319348 RepID=A0A9J6CF18_POLVA|nr:hypothetical protein PVAND_009909 [Polypedilum vanderplanki]
MSKTDKKIEKNGQQESISSKRLPKFFTSQPDLLLNPLSNQRSQTNKKSYAPNLNVTRNKNSNEKNSFNEPKKDANSRTKPQRGNKDGNNKGNKRNAPQLIQTHGFLSEGLAGTPLTQKRYGGEYSGASSKDVGVETIVKPRIIKRDPRQMKEELETEQKVLQDFLADDDSEMDEDVKTQQDDMMPIKIKTNSKSCNSNAVVSRTNSNDVKIKIEKTDDFDIKREPLDIPNGIKIKIEPGLETETSIESPPPPIHELFNADSSQIFLFQMPDSIPGQTSEDDDSSKPCTSAEATTKPKSRFCTLEHLEEGPIGKLIRHKSGKIKLKIGDAVFDIDPALKCDFIQNAVTIDSNPQQRSANMYSLGKIQTKYNVSPDWNWFFENLKS